LRHREAVITGLNQQAQNGNAALMPEGSERVCSFDISHNIYISSFLDITSEIPQSLEILVNTDASP
jgi:hypothetical protein